MLGCNSLTGASSIGLSTRSSASAATGTGVEYLEMSAAGSSSTKLQNPDTLKTLDATQLPKGNWSLYGGQIKKDISLLDYLFIQIYLNSSQFFNTLWYFRRSIVLYHFKRSYFSPNASYAYRQADRIRTVYYDRPLWPEYRSWRQCFSRYHNVTRYLFSTNFRFT